MECTTAAFAAVANLDTGAPRRCRASRVQGQGTVSSPKEGRDFNAFHCCLLAGAEEASGPPGVTSPSETARNRNPAEPGRPRHLYLKAAAPQLEKMIPNAEALNPHIS